LDTAATFELCEKPCGWGNIPHPALNNLLITIVTNKENIVFANEVDIAKFRVKRELQYKHLPPLSEHVEELLFLQGRTAWTYQYADIKVIPRKVSTKISFIITALLKKEFHLLVEQHRFKFIATSVYYPETQKLKIDEIRTC
jgi:hypothetical protein